MKIVQRNKNLEDEELHNVIESAEMSPDGNAIFQEIEREVIKIFPNAEKIFVRLDDRFDRSTRTLVGKEGEVIKSRFANQIKCHSYGFAIHEEYTPKPSELVPLKEVAKQVGLSVGRTTHLVGDAHGKLVKNWRAHGTCGGDVAKCVCIPSRRMYRTEATTAAFCACLYR